ncbi:hypothetical protein P3S68_027682 [Capsicum galapagoense]
MNQRLSVDAITKETTGWTCKIQVVDKFRPLESKDRSVQFQTMLVQDESLSSPRRMFLLKNGAHTHAVFKKFITYNTFANCQLKPGTTGCRSTLR